MKDAEIKLVERDICYLYHELAEYRSIMEDLDYKGQLSRSYWNYLNPPIEQDPSHFVQEGCLLLILCMAWDLIEGQRNQLETSIDTCRWQIDAIEPDSEKTVKLVNIVRKALVFAELEGKPDSEMNEEAQWAYDAVVTRYFQERSQPNRPEI